MWDYNPVPKDVESWVLTKHLLLGGATNKHIQTGSCCQIETQADRVFQIEQSARDSQQSLSYEVSMLEPTPEAQLRLIQKMDGFSSQMWLAQGFFQYFSSVSYVNLLILFYGLNQHIVHVCKFKTTLLQNVAQQFSTTVVYLPTFIV